ncbi:MAG TPA: hypothetical protein ENK53_06920 [Thiotrichales bacterium]|nr:hypothetical protein [Thiotrichales bacterium]
MKDGGRGDIETLLQAAQRAVTAARRVLRRSKLEDDEELLVRALSLALDASMPRSKRREWCLE